MRDDGRTCGLFASAYPRRASGSLGESWQRSAPGLVVLLGVARGDTDAGGDRLATKIAALRIFENEEGKFDRSLLDVNGDALVVSQFTLIADTQKGNRPSFSDAAPPEEAEPRYDALLRGPRPAGSRCGPGRFSGPGWPLSS